MKFIVSSSSLLKQLQMLSGVLNTSNSLPILDDFLFEIASSKLTITASDLETTIISVIEIESKEDGQIAIPAKLLGSKIIFYMFESTPEQTAHNYGLGADSRLVRLLCWVEGISVRFAHRVITVSPYDRDKVVHRSRPQSEQAVVMNVPEESLFRPVTTLQEDDSAFRVITHGSILRRYGIQTLIRAVPHLTEHISELEVVILGDGEYRVRDPEEARLVLAGFGQVVPDNVKDRNAEYQTEGQGCHAESSGVARGRRDTMGSGK